MNGVLKKLIMISTLGVLITFYVWGAIQHSSLVNIRTQTGDIDHGDQEAYLQAIKKTREENFRYLGDRTRMPLYNFFQAIFYTSGISDAQLFIQAKFINIVFSLFLLYLIFVFNQRYLSKFSNIVFILIVSFSVFLPRSAYVQPELLYFTLSYFAFVYFCRTIKNEKLSDTIWVAILAAFAYLTKASMLLGVELFVFSLFMLNPKSFIRTKIITILIIFIFVFLSILAPYIIQTKKIYGSYFFNYATVYMWREKWDDVLPLDKQLKNVEYLRSLPKNQLPSLPKYLREHSIHHLAFRMISGIVLNIGILLGTYASLSTAILILYIPFLAFFTFTKNRLTYFRRYLNQNKKIIIFISSYLLLYFLAFSWYAPIGVGPRFILPLYMPTLFSVFYLFERLTIKSKAAPSSSIDNGLFYLINIIAVLILSAGVKTLIIPTLFTSWAGF